MRVEGSQLWWAANTSEGPATVLVERGDVAGAWGPGASELVARVPGVLGRLDNARDFVPPDGLVADLAHRQGVPALGRTGDVMSAVVQAVFGQRVTVEEARGAWKLLVRRFGTPAPGPRTDMYVAPDAAALGRLPYYAFHRLGVDRRRAETIIGAARRGERLAALVDQPSTEVERVLNAFPGIGPWSSAHVRVVALGDPDAVPVGDLHLPSVVTYALAGERVGTDGRMLELLEPYRGHRFRVVRLLMSAHLGPERRSPKARIHAIGDL